MNGDLNINNTDRNIEPLVFDNEYVNELYHNDTDGNDELTSLLSNAVCQGNITHVMQLINAGADVNIETECNITPLIIASFNGYSEIVKILIQNGANINHRDNINRTSLIMACRNGSINTVKILIENNADVNIKNSNGDTAIEIARACNHVNIVEYLLNNTSHR